jgi:hypothetical protein
MIGSSATEHGGDMRGRFRDQGGLFSYISPEHRVPRSHPLRRVRQLVREVLEELSRSFGRLYARRAAPRCHWSSL